MGRVGTTWDTRGVGLVQTDISPDMAAGDVLPPLPFIGKGWKWVLPGHGSAQPRNR